MSLSDTFADMASEKPSFPSIPLEALGMEPEKFRIVIPASNCTAIEKEDGYFYDRPYRYGIAVEFDNAESRDAFFNDPNISESASTIQQTVEKGLQETLEIESERDSGGVYGDQDDLIRSINGSTMDDIGIVMQEQEAIIKSTFPDAGIKSIGIEDIHGVDANCPYVEGPFAGVLTPQPQIKTSDAKLGL